MKHCASMAHHAQLWHMQMLLNHNAAQLQLLQAQHAAEVQHLQAQIQQAQHDRVVRDFKTQHKEEIKSLVPRKFYHSTSILPSK